MTPQKILIIKPSALGDIIHTLPLVAAIKKKYSGSHITWVVGKNFQDILAGNPDIDELIIFDRQRWGGGILRFFQSIQEIWIFFQKIHSGHYDVVIDLQGLFRSAAMTIVSRSPVRIGFSNARELAFLSYNRRVKTPPNVIHAVDRYKLLAHAMGVEEVENSFPVFLSKKERDFVRDSLVKYTLKCTFIAIAPGARWLTKRWPSEYFAQTMDKFAKKQDKVTFVLVGAKGDKEIGEQIIQHCQTNVSICNLIGKTSLKELAAILEKANVVLSNDSGPMHLSVAMGTPTLGIFGPTYPEKTGPYGSQHYAIKKNLCDRKCKRSCDHNLRCLHAITPTEVSEFLETMLERSLNGCKVVKNADK